MLDQHRMVQATSLRVERHYQSSYYARPLLQASLVVVNHSQMLDVLDFAHPRLQLYRELPQLQLLQLQLQDHYCVSHSDSLALLSILKVDLERRSNMQAEVILILASAECHVLEL